MSVLAVPTTLEAALDPAWLARALAEIGGGAPVVEVKQVEVLRTMATKVRFTVRFADSDAVHAFCLKGFLDVEGGAAHGGATTVLEADFYAKVAPHVNVRVPTCVAAIIDRQAPLGVIIMHDLIATQGARFCSALEAFSADEAAQSVEVLAELHAGKGLLQQYDWIGARAGQLARSGFIPAPVLQDLLDGPRGVNLTPAVRNAERLIAAMLALADRDEKREQFLVHGDSHAGNLYRTASGPGLIDWQLLQRGGWALDVAYHLNAVLPHEVAAAEERRLLGHYLGVMRGKGFAMPDDEEAWRQYREAAIYGYFLWAITRRVDPPIIAMFVDRLGKAVTRLESHALLGIA